MNGQVVFLNTSNASRGGLLAGIGVMTKEAFLTSVEEGFERNKDAFRYSLPCDRFAFIDGEKSLKFKNMELSVFEEVFTEADIERLRLALEYGKSYDKYPHFRKAVYLKYGVNKEVTK